MQRNAVIALGNSGDPGAVKPLAQLLSNDPRPLIRIHSAWALGQIGGSAARYYLQSAAEKDPDQAVREEALLALS